MRSIVEELRQTELFQNVSIAAIEQLLKQTEPRALAAGEVLLSPEQDNEYIYLLLSGTLSLHFDSSDSPEIRELPQYVSVGEMSLIDNARPSAYVIAKEVSRVFPIHRDILYHLVAGANPIAYNMLRLRSKWMKANTQRIVHDRSQITKLTNHANIDSLTGLYNRRWLNSALQRLLENEQPLCLLLIDVDHFKRYNDTQGHQGGDQALIALGNVLKTTVRPYDFPTRYGGEEFLVLLPMTSMVDGGIGTAERIRQAAALKKIFSTDLQPLPGITISIGLAESDADSTSESLIAAADAQLYRA
ncbi:MAG: GGDEF domain-containing protein, partial [Gammaproteobacteria bacterium]|nr:GGDEF domain-containing protein [Gammaproteobacteria bacterium]